MPSKFQTQFDTEHPGVRSLCTSVRSALEQYRLTGTYEVEEIITEACDRSPEKIESSETTEILLAWLGTACLEVLKELSKQHANRQQFDTAVKTLFDANNPDSHVFFANVARTLHQFRLSKAYNVREIITEAYYRGTKKIKSGTIIQNPIAWMRTACLYVIYEFRREQEKHKPQIDSEGLTPGDEVLSKLLLEEDHRAMRVAWRKLNDKDREILRARIFQHKSWQEIGWSLSTPGEPEMNANTVRQRKHRALRRLCQYYEEARREVQTNGDGTESLTDLDIGLDKSG